MRSAFLYTSSSVSRMRINSSSFMSAPSVDGCVGTSIVDRKRADAQQGLSAALRVLSGVHVATVFFLPFEVIANGFEKFAAARNGGVSWNR